VSGEAAKKFVRTPWVQSILAWLVATYLGMTLVTIRWRFEGRDVVDAAAVSPAGVIGFTWHGRLAVASLLVKLLKQKPRRVLISQSPDGELVAKVVGWLGVPAIRGSSTLDGRRNRRSIEAFRDAVRFIDSGGVMMVTPDGPRGPAQQMPHGPIVLARTRETPVIVAGFAVRPAITLRSWDRTQIPLPFARGGAVFAEPVRLMRDAGPEAVEATRVAWQASLNAVQTRAEALAGAR
jgi:hypothetical protein